MFPIMKTVQLFRCNCQPGFSSVVISSSIGLVMTIVGVVGATDFIESILNKGEAA